MLFHDDHGCGPTTDSQRLLRGQLETVNYGSGYVMRRTVGYRLQNSAQIRVYIVASLSGQLVTVNMKFGTRFFRTTVDCDGTVKTSAFLSADEARRSRLLGLRTR